MRWGMGSPGWLMGCVVAGWRHGIPCPAHCGRPDGSPRRDGRRTTASRRAPACGGVVMVGIRYGLWEVRYVGATRRVAPTMGNPTRWATRCNGRRAPARGGGVMGGTRYGMGVRYVGATRRVAPTMGNPTRWVTHAMGDAPRCPDANRDGRMGTVYRTPTIVGDPAGRPYDGQPDDGRRTASFRRAPGRQDGHGIPYPDHCGRPGGSPLRDGRRTASFRRAPGRQDGHGR
ncbi:MAG: hypothetical protein KatS3mg055_0028 [Chloroflexus sp.]|nr:MAG: hypothetical protein KatS3mg055_0028 [Chloroflexus sp.]